MLARSRRALLEKSTQIYAAGILTKAMSVLKPSSGVVCALPMTWLGNRQGREEQYLAKRASCAPVFSGWALWKTEPCGQTRSASSRPAPSSVVWLHTTFTTLARHISMWRDLGYKQVNENSQNFLQPIAVSLTAHTFGLLVSGWTTLR